MPQKKVMIEEKKLEVLTVKSAVYDLIAQRDWCNNEINKMNQRLVDLNQPPVEDKEKKPTLEPETTNRQAKRRAAKAKKKVVKK